MEPVNGKGVDDPPCGGVPSARDKLETPSDSDSDDKTEVISHSRLNKDLKIKRQVAKPRRSDEDELTVDRSGDGDSKSIVFDLCRLCARPFPGCISLFSEQGNVYLTGSDHYGTGSFLTGFKIRVLWSGSGVFFFLSPDPVRDKIRTHKKCPKIVSTI